MGAYNICQFYTYDDRGRVVSERQNGNVITSTYDERGRLSQKVLWVSELYDVSTTTYSYDLMARLVSVNKNDVYCVNYLSGNVIKMPETIVTHSGKGIHPTRQEAPHTHFAGFTPDGKYLCVTDLGLDTVFLYYPDMTLKGSVAVPKGHGARHLVFFG